MELALLVLGLFLLVVTPILALVAFVRSQAMVRVEIEVKRLQRRLDGALTRVAQLEARLGGEAQSGAALEEGDLDAPEPASAEDDGEDWSIEDADDPDPFPDLFPGLGHQRGAPPRRERTPAFVEPSAARDRESGAAARFDWERWLGVRGAALVGGALLALAGLLLVRHMIDQGWLGPGARVILATAIGLICLVGVAPLAKRGYGLVAEAIGGAGLVMLYGSAWASDQLYGFIGTPAAFAAMTLTTGAAVALSWRHGARTILYFAAVGGFVTPLILGTWRDNPLGLFGYALLLDLALLSLARKRGWVSIEVLAAVGTVLLQALWGAERANAASAGVGLGALFVFGALFIAAGSKLLRIAGAASVLGLALMYAARADLDVELWQLGLVWVPLAGLLVGLERADGEAWISHAVAAATVGLALAWLGGQGVVTPGVGWQFTGVLGVAAALLAAAVRLTGDDEDDARGLAVLIVGAGLALGLFGFGFARGGEFGPWFAGTSAVAALLPVLFVATGRALERSLAPMGLVAGLVAVRVAGPWAAAVAAAVAIAVLALAAWRTGAGTSARRMTAAAAVFVLLPALVTLPEPAVVDGAVRGVATAPWLLLGLALVGTLAAVWGATPGAHAALVLAAGVAAWRWDVHYLKDALSIDVAASETGPLPFAFALRVATGATLALLPPLASRGWHAAAAAPALLFLFGETTPWSAVWGDAHVAWLPAALACVAGAGAALTRARSLGPFALARASAVAVGLASLAIALAIGTLWPLATLALGGGASAWIARGIGHRKLYFTALLAWGSAALMLLGAPVAFELKASPWLLSPRLAWLYLVPAGAAAALLVRERGWLDASLRGAVGVLAALLVFLWINLTVFDAFEPGARLRYDWRHSQLQNLTQSATWIAFALALLVGGTARHLGGLRWLSLGFLVLALLKVGLWDLGELGGLFRVASIAGLAIALLGVSVLYQRFVFAKSLEHDAVPLR